MRSSRRVLWIMDFIFALNHSIILCRLEFVSRRKAYSREQRKFHDVGGLGRILLVLCGCPSEANVWKPPVFVGRLLPLARGPRGNEYQATTKWKETERAHHCNRGGCVLWSAESSFPFSLYIWHSHSASNHPC